MNRNHNKTRLNEKCLCCNAESYFGAMLKNTFFIFKFTLIV